MHDPFKITQPTCISFSGGRTSAYMLWRVLQANGGLPVDTVVCFANTGKEVEATMRFVRDCAEHWHVPIRWLEYLPTEPGFTLVDFDRASRQGEPFEALIRKRQYLPNPVARGCTTYGADGIVNSSSLRRGMRLPGRCRTHPVPVWPMATWAPAHRLHDLNINSMIVVLSNNE